MAIMWPRMLPDWVTADRRRAAEIAVFRKLEKQLDDEWSVFYSRPWWGINQRGGEIDGEADFILAHAEHGLLFLEVKGGRISYDPLVQQWKTKDRDGITYKIKDPIHQAMTCKHNYLKKLKSVEGWPEDYIRFRHGAVFPDSSSPPADDPALGCYEKRLFCHSEEFDNAFEQWILERLASHADNPGRVEAGPGEAGIHAVYELVAKPAILRVPLVREVQGDLAVMESLLTGAQLALIGIIEPTERALVEGGAGTGKTVLAMEIAAHEAARGHSVLFCCGSSPLATWVAARMSGVPGINVMTFLEVQTALAGKLQDDQHSSGRPTYDTVVIDEAQDFAWEWWDLIERIMDRPGAKLRVFADSNQAIYRMRDDLETRLRAKAVPLCVNLRNTRKISRVTDSLYKGPLVMACGPEGTTPTCEICDLETAKRRAGETALQLVRRENVPASMIAILVPDQSIRESMCSLLARHGIAVTDALRGPSQGITVDTVDRFKGLETAVLLMISNRDLCRNQELSYVGVSRSRSRLFVYGPIAGSTLEQALSAEKLDNTAN